MNRATLLTDFGTRDGYVAAMKGVIATIAPSAFVDDASHDIPPGDILAAAFALRRYWKLYPPGTVHLVVVDPGVGSERAAVAIEAEARFLVGPDNGVFTFTTPQKIIQLDSSSAASHTFHGRDVFAPAAGRLLAGGRLEDLGEPAASLVQLAIPKPNGQQGEVIAIDRFGNLITNFTTAADVEIQGVIAKAKKIYSEVAEGELLALLNSDGWLEIAARNGSAAQTLGVSRGAVVKLRL
jgi:S-adenosylmethionine hydrolase